MKQEASHDPALRPGWRIVSARAATRLAIAGLAATGLAVAGFWPGLATVASAQGYEAQDLDAQDLDAQDYEDDELQDYGAQDDERGVAEEDTVLPPYEVATIVRSADLEPLSPPARRGPYYVLRAIDSASREVRVVLDARTGDIVRVVPLTLAARMPPARAPDVSRAAKPAPAKPAPARRTASIPKEAPLPKPRPQASAAPETPAVPAPASDSGAELPN